MLDVWTGEKITDSANTGNIEGLGKLVGGIVGAVLSGNIEDCSNSGKVLGKTAYVGGIIGIDVSEGKIENCYNINNVSGNGNYVGGITGECIGAEIKSSHNTGYIYSETGLVGGIAGALYKHENGKESKVESCYNTGKIEAKGGANENLNSIAGGIVGETVGNITRCWNSGNVVTEYSAVGGITGASDGEITQCYNKGTLETKNPDVAGWRSSRWNCWTCS